MEKKQQEAISALKIFRAEIATRKTLNNIWHQAGAELGQAQVKLNDLVAVVVDVEVIGEVKVEV